MPDKWGRAAMSHVNDPGNTRFANERFAEQASRRPGAAAVIAAGTRLTYGELDSSANRLARCLVDLGAGPETLIGVHAERGAQVHQAAGTCRSTRRCRRPGWPGSAQKPAPSQS
jgi:non-ribosomal peptide synthetase component F